MNSRDNKTSGEIKREVLNELRNVRRDLDTIQNRLTPGQFIDDILFKSVGKNTRAIFDHLMANPIGTAFLSIGTILLMENEAHVSFEKSLGNRAKAKTRSKIEEFRERFSSKKNTQGDGFTYNAGGEMGQTSMDYISAKADQVKESISNLDPMTFLAIGASLGAVTAISLPVSEKEQSIIDQKLSGPLSELSQEFQDAINQSVQTLKNEFLGTFSDMDVNLFKKKSRSNDHERSV